MEFIREHADQREGGGLRWGVEPICTVLTEHGLPIEGIAIARCTVERLMGVLKWVGGVRGTVKRTTVADPAAERAKDLVNRDFTPPAPDRLWVADMT